MALSTELISQFAKITKDDKRTKKETTEFGTIAEYGGKKYVKLDGSDLLTPVTMTVDAEVGERVTVLLKNHTATVTGNISSPSARTESVTIVETTITERIESQSARITDLETDNADIYGTLTAQGAKITQLEASDVTINNTLTAQNGKIETLETNNVTINNTLNAYNAKIANLEASDATINGTLTAQGAKITDLETDNATINNTLTAHTAEIETLKAMSGDFETLSSTYAKIESLNATNARVTNLETNSLTANSAVIKDLQTGKANVADLNAAVGRIEDLEADSITAEEVRTNYLTANDIKTTYLAASDAELEYAKISTLESDYAKVDLANVETASIGTVLAKAGLITSATIQNGHVTGYLDSVEVNANSITAGTLSVDRLIISGSDKSIIYSINNAGDLVSTVTDTINGDVITKRTIAADHIIAGAITANELHSGAVTTEKILSGAVTADKITATSLESIVAKIGSFSINNALYTNNHAAYDTLVNGVYVGSDYISLGSGGKTWLKNDGSVSIGDGAITYNSTNKTLVINANEIKMDSQSLATLEYADEKAATAETNANSYTNQTANNITSTVSSTYATKTELTNKVDAIQIGGTNLAVGTNNDWTNITIGTWSGQLRHKIAGETSAKYVRSSSDLGEIGDTVTISLELNAINKILYLRIDQYESDGSTYKSAVGYHVPVGSSAKSSVTITLSEQYPTLNFYIGTTGAVESNTTEQYRGFKIEKGNKATDWSPAPEDMVAQEEFEAVETRVANAETSIQQTSEAIELKASKTELTEAVNNVRVGSRNYIRPSRVRPYTTYITRTGYTDDSVSFKFVESFMGSWVVFDVEGLKIEDDIYTLSGYVKVNDAIPESKYFTGLASTYGSGLISNTYDPETGYFTITQSYVSTSPWVMHGATTRTSGSTDIVTLSKLKFEKGNKATDWTPAPEDMAKQTDLDSVTNRVTTAETAITQNATDITLRATKTELTNAVDGIQVGGRNLVLNSKVEVSNNEYNLITKSPSSPLVSGETYTVSLCVTPAAGVSQYSLYVSGGYKSLVNLYPSGTDKQVISKTFVASYYSGRTPEDNLGYANLQIYRFPNNETVTTNTTFHWMKVEKGTRATDWTPAPEDMATNSDLDSVETRVTSAETKITQNANSITSLATRTTNIEGRVTSAETAISQNSDSISAVATRTTATETDIASLELTASGLTTRLSTAETNISSASSTANAALERTNVKDTRSVNETPAWYMTNHPKRLVVEFKGCNTIGLTGATYCSLETVVPWGDKSGGYPKQTATVNEKQYWRTGISETEWGAWMAASETATNYLNFSSGGLVVGDMTASTLGKNVLIDSDSVDIRNGSTVLASFSEDQIDLGINSETSKINLCGGAGVISAESKDGTSVFDATRIDSRQFSIYSEDLFIYTASDEMKATQDSTRAYTHISARSLNGTTPEAVAYINSSYRDDTEQQVSIVTTHSESGETYINLNAGRCPSGGAWTENNIRMTPDYTDLGGYPTLKFGTMIEVKDNNDYHYFQALTSGSTTVGYGSYKNGYDLELYGDDIDITTKKGTYRPYLQAGDSLSFTIRTAGYVTNSKTEIHFHIPLSKPLLGDPTITASSVSGIICRQEALYTHGSTASVYATPTSYSAWKVSDLGIAVKAVFTDTTNALNNAPCGVCWSGKITLS